MRSAFRPDEAGNLAETYELRIDERVFEVRIADGRCMTSEGRAYDPDTVISLDVHTLYELLFGLIGPEEATEARRVEIVKGDEEAVKRFTRTFVFDIPDRDAVRSVRG